MAEVVLHPDSQAFPPGTVVKVFPRVKNSPYPAEGRPLGTELEGPTISTAGVLTVKGVTAEGSYIGWSQRGNTDYYLTFVVPPAASGSSGITQLKVEELIAEKSVSTASPAFTGTPTAPTAAAATNTMQLATTAFATGAVATEKSARETATTAVSGEVASEKTARESAVATNTANIATAKTEVGTEKTAREGADSTLTTNVATAKTEAGTAKTEVATEKTRAETKEALLRLTATKIKSTTQARFVIPGKVEVGTILAPPLRVATGETVFTADLDYKIAKGTSFTFKIQKNGADITGFGTTASPLECTKVGVHATPTGIEIKAGEELSLVILGIVGAPEGLALGVAELHEAS